MKSIVNILVFVFCTALLVPAFGQTIGGKKTKSNKRLKDRKERSEVQSEFDLEYRLDCNLKLDRARALFEKGLLEKIPILLKDCVDNRDLSRNTQIAILKILAETHLFLNQENRAADYYNDLLKLDPFFQAKPQIDHPELVHLSNEFITVSPFSIGMYLGAQRSMVNSRKQFLNTEKVSSLEDDFKGKWNMTGGAFLTYRPGKGKIELTAELNYASYRYEYTGDMIPVSNIGSSRLVLKERDQLIQLPLSFKYLFSKSSIRPYIYVGIAPTFTFNARLEDLRRTLEENGNLSQEQTTGLDISSKASIAQRNLVNLNSFLGLGLQYHYKRFYLFGDLYYSKMLTNVVNTDNRLNNESLINDLWHVDNDFSFDGLGLKLGVGYSIFRSKRK